MSKHLNLVQSGYNLLVLLAISDRHYHEKEATQIKNFIKIHYNIRGFTATPMVNFEEMTEKERLNEIIRIANVFMDEDSSKYRMIEFAYSLIIADHKITVEEKERFRILEKMWGIEEED